MINNEDDSKSYFRAWGLVIGHVGAIKKAVDVALDLLIAGDVKASFEGMARDDTRKHASSDLMKGTDAHDQHTHPKL